MAAIRGTYWLISVWLAFVILAAPGLCDARRFDPRNSPYQPLTLTPVGAPWISSYSLSSGWRLPQPLWQSAWCAAGTDSGRG